MRNLKGALPSAKLASQYGVLAGLRVKLIYGLAAPMHGRPLCPRRATLYPVSCVAGPSIDGWGTNLVGSASVTRPVLQRPMQIWRQELPDLLLQRAEFNMNTGLTKKLQSLAVVSRIWIHDAHEHRPEASGDQGYGT